MSSLSIDLVSSSKDGTLAKLGLRDLMGGVSVVSAELTVAQLNSFVLLII